MTADQSLRQHVIAMLKGGHAHVPFAAAVKGLPVALRGKRPKNGAHSPWEVLEHIRIAQWDILEFSRDPHHFSPAWPEGYWPQTPAPPNAAAWAKSVRAVEADLEAMCSLVADEANDLHAPFAHGTGQTLLREALLVADHNAYHIGELVILRRTLGAWK
jgi:hypothetical protein